MPEVEQLSPQATTTEPRLLNKRSHRIEKPLRSNEDSGQSKIKFKSRGL